LLKGCSSLQGGPGLDKLSPNGEKGMRTSFVALLPLILLACSPDNATGQNSAASAESAKPFKTSIIADFDSPWAMTFLPDGRALITEKAGEMILFDPKNGTKIPIAGIPQVDSAGQGGLMDVVLAPGFAKDGTVYFSFSESGPGGKGVSLATGIFNQASDGTTKLDGVKTIFRATPYVEGNGHYSGRIAFSPDGKYLFFTNGERQKFDPAQDPRRQGFPPRHLVLRPPQPAWRRFRQGWPPVGAGNGPQGRRRGKPDQARAQLWLSQGVERGPL
jgi:glucose/arabinose dehydrogenase